MVNNKTLATELLHIVKGRSKRWFISFIIVLSLLITSNLAWFLHTKK